MIGHQNKSSEIEEEEEEEIKAIGSTQKGCVNAGSMCGMFSIV